MAAFRVQTVIKTTDNIPENFVTNSWCFDYTLSTVNVDATEAALKAFYDACRPVLFPAGIAMSGHLNKYYALPGSKPNYPQDERAWAFAVAPSDTALPSEVALCLSFQGERTSGEAQARKQGRVYLGPCRQTANMSGRPASSVRSTIASAALQLRDDIATNTDGYWAVWSVANQTAVEVTDGWIDDAWDTQRRRGVARTARTTW